MPNASAPPRRSRSSIADEGGNLARRRTRRMPARSRAPGRARRRRAAPAESGPSPGSSRAAPPSASDQPLRLRLEVVPPAAPRAVDRLEHLAEAREPVARLGREVGPARRTAAPPGSGRRSSANRPGPSSSRTASIVNGVDVGPLLAIDLDAHEQVVHQPRRRVIGERLVLHDVTPVARAVADRHEQRTILRARAGERLVPPRVPLDGVPGVLEQVRARRVGQAIHVVTVRGRSPSRRVRARWGGRLDGASPSAAALLIDDGRAPRVARRCDDDGRSGPSTAAARRSCRRSSRARGVRRPDEPGEDVRREEAPPGERLDVAGGERRRRPPTRE